MTSDFNIQVKKNNSVLQLKIHARYNSHVITSIIVNCLSSYFQFVLTDTLYYLYIYGMNEKIDRFYYGDCCHVRHKYISVEILQVFKTRIDQLLLQFCKLKHL